jgi:hypothetical protein
LTNEDFRPRAQSNVRFGSQADLRPPLDKLFPQGRAITPHRKLWFEDEIIRWQRDLQNPDSALSQAMALRARKAKPV